MSDRCDVLVIGGGGAALRAAIAAHEAAPELRVVLVTKGELGTSGVTATACSDRMAFHATLPTTPPGGPDAWRYHADDIYRLGGRVSDADLAAILARESAAAFDYLDRLGVPWVRRADGTVDQFVTDGSIHPRACYTGPYTAIHIAEALQRRLRELPIEVIERHMAAELLRGAQGAVRGAVLVSEETNEARTLAARAVVLATGGAGQAFARNVYPPDCTGDGQALAYRAGAELVNLEFIQLGLCSVATGLACSGSMLRALPRLVNDAGEEFLLQYFPPGTRRSLAYNTLFAKGASWPVSFREPSHIIDIAVDRQLASGRRVFLDYGRDPEGLCWPELSEHVRAWHLEAGARAAETKRHAATPLARLRGINPQSIAWLAERGVHLERGDLLEVAPSAQHFQGGVKIRARAETTVPGLYACGEVAGGQHGANRPGGNALLDCQVFGRIAGESAACQAQGRGDQAAALDESADEIVARLLQPNGASPHEVHRRAGEAMSRYCGVYRTAEGLATLCREIDGLIAGGVRAEGSLAEALEVVNLLQVAQLVARAALERDESRGPHLRFATAGDLAPIPRRDGDWDRYIVIRRGRDGRPVLQRREPVRPD